MSVFSSLFGSSNYESNKSDKIAWTELTDLGGLNEIAQLSERKPIIIFKHSTRCSVSRMALKQFENEYDLGENVLPYYLDLLEYRSVSNEIAVRFNVVHQSPQLLLIVCGICVYNASHGAIDATILASKL